MVTAERLREVLDYDHKTGLFSRKMRGSIMLTRREWTVGHITDFGYAVLRVDGRLYMAHRLAWLHFYGRWPSKQINHKNSVRADNRIENLREVTPGQISHGGIPARSSATGLRGAHWHKGRRKWASSIMCNGKMHHLGYFDTARDANAAYEKAAVELFGEYAKNVKVIRVNDRSVSRNHSFSASSRDFLIEE